MNQRILKVLLWLDFTIFLLFLVFLIWITKIDYSADIPVEKPETEKTGFNIYPCLHSLDLSNLKESFPYTVYLDSGNWKNAGGIKNDLAVMDSVNKDNEMLNQEVLSIALTEKLEDRIKPSFLNYNPDSLIRILQWAEKFNAYSELDEKNSILFQVIYNYWFNFVSNNLRDNYEKDYALKYNYKFRYIADRLREKQFSTPIRGTYFEKTVNKIIDKNWAYLFNKFWHATSVLYKLIVLLLFLLIIFPYIYIFKSIKRKSL